MKTNLPVSTASFALSLLLLAAPGTGQADIVYVTDSGSDTIEEFNSAGTGTIFATASSGLSTPQGLAIDGAGNLYVANEGNNTIEKFDSSGNGTVFASSGLNNPGFLCFDSSGHLYVLNGDGTIEKFDSTGNGSLFASIGLNIDSGITCDGSGNVYVVSDLLPHSELTVRKIDSNGNASTFYSILLIPPYPFLASGGIAFDGNSNLYVAADPFSGLNARSGVIERINSVGAGSPFTSSGASPFGALAFGSDGDLYAVSGSIIEEFDSSGNGTLFASGLFDDVGIAVEAVPEPSAAMLLAAALITLLLLMRRRVSSSAPAYR